MKKRKKVLIIKTGFSEFLDMGISTAVSLGDVLVCTSILHVYKNDQVTWVTSWKAHQLLQNNPFIDKLLIFGPDTFGEVGTKNYDILINLEKDIGICAFVSRIKAVKRYGFYFNPRKRDIDTYKTSTQFLLLGQENQREIKKTGFEILYDSIDQKWEGQGAILVRKHPGHPKYDIGFNYSVGKKWPTKAWPLAYWKKLESLLASRYTISWQQGHKNIKSYMRWLEQCRLIVTSDSLAQILAQAMGREVISLYGPTYYRRMHGVPQVTIIRSTLRCPHLPCYLPICKYHKFCMEFISPLKVAKTCERLLK
ncbi:MAG: glycosyltransferase family 9 protein [Candidatus Omnitrophota bacterium]